jgi:hypothetical protein
MNNNELKLYKHEKGKSQPESLSVLLPKDLGKPPVMPDWNYMKEFTDMMAKIEQAASVPVGLFGWKDSLYLLNRTRQGKQTHWVLYRIDPSGKLSTTQTDLPINANHVTVIPGPKTWAFIEKGPVLGYGAQDASRMLLIPSGLLDAPLRPGSKICN